MFDAFDIPCYPMDIGIIPDNKDVYEPHYHFSQELLDNCPDNVSLVGYFQSEKYFKHIEDEIRQDFTFKNEVAIPCKHMMSTMDTPIALHIRRGDFLINHANHNNLRVEYYFEALREFDDGRMVIIFSDDPEWCKEQPLFF